MHYFEAEDVLHICLRDAPEAASVELSTNITAELDSDGQLIGLEILDASRYLCNSIVESAQARLLALGIDDDSVAKAG